MRRAKLLDRRLEPNKGQRAQIMCLGDLHLGAKTCDTEAVEAAIAKCLEKKIYVVGMGDMLEIGLRDSIGASIYEQEFGPQAQIDEIVDLFKPLADAGLLLGIHMGNHEHRLMQRVGLDIMSMICRRLGTAYLDHAAFHLIRVGGESYTMHTTHGSSGARLPYTKIKAALDVFRYVDTEIVAYGHLHGLDHMTALYSVVNKSRKVVESRTRHAILTGSYLRYHGSYAEQKNLPPVKMGSPIIHLWGNDHKIHVSV